LCIYTTSLVPTLSKIPEKIQIAPPRRCAARRHCLAEKHTFPFRRKSPARAKNGRLQSAFFCSALFWRTGRRGFASARTARHSPSTPLPSRPNNPWIRKV